MNAEEIYNKVMEVSEKAYFNWFADAPVLFRIADTETFPWDYASDIKVAILNCFANLALDNIPVTEDEKTIVDKIYNDFYGSKNPNEICARRKMLCATIIGSEKKAIKTPIKAGEQFKRIRDIWREMEFKEYENEEHINLYALCDIMAKYFNKVITEADEQGMLDLDKENSTSENGELVIGINYNKK